MFFSSGCVSYVREGYSERACRENYVDQNVVSVPFCPHLHYITVLWPCKLFPQCNVPSGPSVLKGDWLQSRSFGGGLKTSIFQSLAVLSGAVGAKLPLCAPSGKVLKFHSVARTNAPFPRVWSQISLGFVALVCGI